MVEWWAWASAVAFIVALLTVDLMVFHRDAHEVGAREAAIWTVVWVTLGVGFAGLVSVTLGTGAAAEYLTGYVLEKSLSIDNIVVFALLFGYFEVPAAYQHRVLFWGVVGGLLLRAMFILAGAALLDAFHGAIYLFGAFLVLTGVRMARHDEREIHPERNPLLGLLRRLMPTTAGYRGQRFFVREEGRRLVTPLLLVLVVVESTDLLFAVDSIPAIFGVTTNRFLVFTSNAFAMLGLRALYFLLAGMIGRFVHLKVGLAMVLVFVGGKMLVTDLYQPPIWMSLSVIAVIIGTSVVSSLLSTPARQPALARQSSAPGQTRTQG